MIHLLCFEILLLSPSPFTILTILTSVPVDRNIGREYIPYLYIGTITVRVPKRSQIECYSTSSIPAVSRVT